MVDMVNDEVRGSIHYPAVHLDGFSGISCGGVKCISPWCGGPFIFAQLVIIGRIDESEFSAGKGYSPDGFGAFLPVFVGTSTRRTEGTAGIEIVAGLVETDYPPSAGVSGFLFAGQLRTAQAHHPDRKKAVIATDMIRIAYVVMRIAYHRILKNRTQLVP